MTITRWFDRHITHETTEWAVLTVTFNSDGRMIIFWTGDVNLPAMISRELTEQIPDLLDCMYTCGLRFIGKTENGDYICKLKAAA